MKPTLPAGYSVKFAHFRGYGDDGEPDETGGRTIACVLDARGHLAAIGKAECNQVDSFRYDLGESISLGRAMKEYGLR